MYRVIFNIVFTSVLLSSALLCIRFAFANEPARSHFDVKPKTKTNAKNIVLNHQAYALHSDLLRLKYQSGPVYFLTLKQVAPNNADAALMAHDDASRTLLKTIPQNTLFAASPQCAYSHLKGHFFSDYRYALINERLNYLLLTQHPLPLKTATTLCEQALVKKP